MHMNDLELINRINMFSISNNEKSLLELLNELFNDKEYKDHLEETFCLISITEMYGFLAYFNEEERNMFYEFDKIKRKTYKGREIEFYNKGQLSLLFEMEKEKKIFLSAPTSFGKTSLVLEYIFDNFKGLKNILFIVPTNSLLEELFQKVCKFNKKLNNYYWISTQPYLHTADNNFLILTPERYFLVSENINIDVFDLVVMDETYKIVDSRNKYISDFLESRALRFRKVADMIGETHNRLILLSPFTYSLTDSMGKYLKKYEIKKIDRKLEYVNREIISITSSKEFENNFEKIIGYTSSSSISKKTNFILDKLKGEKNIVYVSKYTEAYKIVEDNNWNTIPNHSKRFNFFIRHLEQNYNIDSTHEWIIITALKRGIGIYISPLPRYMKKEIIKLYNENELSTLIVTTSFTEGVNTNACNLIFTSIINGPNTNKLSDIDVLNVSGRAGRFANCSIGKIYCINDVVYGKVKELQNKSNIELTNYNYTIEKQFDKKSEYEIDMIDDEFLTDEEKEKKRQNDITMEELQLTKKDLAISLCVPTKWKLILYQAINDKNIGKLYRECKCVLDEEENYCNSIEQLFVFIKDAFKENEIDAFPTEPYEIRAFDNSNKFIWGRLYRVYCAGKTKSILAKNIQFIQTQFSEIISAFPYLKNKKKKDLEATFSQYSKKWVLEYYTGDLNLDYNAFYTETFKFISNIVQYKIPFYLSFILSIVKLYVKKNNISDKFNLEGFDPKKVAVLFENGNSNDEYSVLFDYGLSNDIIIKLIENGISVNQIVNDEYDKKTFDEYELLTLEEFRMIFS